MRFLNPKTDYAFKKIFGSEVSRGVLIRFLNAILDLTHALDDAAGKSSRPFLNGILGRKDAQDELVTA